eukprot:Awhi_evm1s12098
MSVLFELTLGHLRYYLTDVPPHPHLSDNVLNSDHEKGNRSLSAYLRTLALSFNRYATPSPPSRSDCQKVNHRIKKFRVIVAI